MAANELIIKDTHRGLYYEDGVLVRVLAAGRYELPLTKVGLFARKPKYEIVLVDVRNRDLTIKNQEILTSDKVAIRVSILVQFAVTDPTAAVHSVASYEDRLYSDVQLAARRALAGMTLEEILTNRHRLSEEILRDVKEAAAGYGVAIARADVKDLVFPGNLQEIMNRVLAAERNSQAQLVEARTKAEVQRIEAPTEAEAQRLQAQTHAEGQRLKVETKAERRGWRSPPKCRRWRSAARWPQPMRATRRSCAWRNWLRCATWLATPMLGSTSTSTTARHPRATIGTGSKWAVGSPSRRQRKRNSRFLFPALAHRPSLRHIL
jgi:regulator of protease activity HflC (stomatin/prohibitin superfamily)